MLNEVSIMGFLRYDPVKRTYDNGNKFLVSFYIYNYSKSRPNLECQPECVAFGSIARTVLKLKKNDLVVVHGCLQTCAYNNSNGVRIRKTEINVNQIWYFSKAMERIEQEKLEKDKSFDELPFDQLL